MKKRSVERVLLLGTLAGLLALAGCGKNKATEEVNESIETEAEGKGLADLTPTPAEETDEKKEESDKEESSDNTKESKDTDKDQKEDSSSGEENDETDAESEEEAAVPVAVLLPADEDSAKEDLSESALLQELGAGDYTLLVYYADGDSEVQADQVEQALQEEAQALVISAVDACALTEVLEQADEAGIPAFAYDTLIRDTDAVNYYVTFDDRKAGQMAAENIVETQELEKARENKESRTIEFLMGSPDDAHALFFYNGVMEVLQEYLDDGTLVCKSEKTSFDDTSIMRWSEKSARTRMEDILTEFYQGEVPDIICTASDMFAHQVVQVLEENEIDAESWPTLTGVGAQAESVKDIAEGKQAFTLFEDGRDMAEACVKIVDTYLGGEKPEVNDYEQYDNGVKIIGTHVCEPQLIDEGNYQILVDNGYYEASEIQPDPTPTSTPMPTLTPTPTEAPELTSSPVSDLTSKSQRASVSEKE